jgi:hypothetical protein
MDARDFLGVGVLGEKKVDESGTRDFGARDEGACRQRGGDSLRELPRLRAGGLGEAQRNARREVAVLRIARTLDQRRQRARRAALRALVHVGDGAQQ